MGFLNNKYFSYLYLVVFKNVSCLFNILNNNILILVIGELGII